MPTDQPSLRSREGRLVVNVEEKINMILDALSTTINANS